MPTPIITDGSMDRLVEAPKVVLPVGGSLFSDRANRFDALASSESMGSYMRLMAHVCRAQAKAFDSAAPQPISETDLRNSREYGMPPFSAHVFARGDQWQKDLKGILDQIKGSPEAQLASVLPTIQRLEALIKEDPVALDAIADRLIAGDCLPEDGPAVPLVGAALQVFFTRLTQTLDASDVSNCDVATVCPCCGMRPTGSIIRLDSGRMNYRYLYCSLCMTEWNMGRVKCTSCENEKGIGYLIIEDDVRSANDAAVRAETCDDCKTYLKIFIQEKEPLIDVLADDLNTLALDILVDEKGYARTGPNLLFYPGQS